MAGFERFEDIEAWQKARHLASMIYRITNEGALSRDFGLKDQMRRAVVSIMSNIAEGFERDAPRDFRRCVLIAKGSAGELRSQLYVAHDANFIDKKSFAELRQRSTEIARMLRSLANHLDRPDNKNL